MRPRDARQVLCLPLCCVCWCRIYVDDLPLAREDGRCGARQDVPMVYSPLSQTPTPDPNADPDGGQPRAAV